MPSELGPFGPTIPWNPGQEEYLRTISVPAPGSTDLGTAYIRIEASGIDFFNVPCFIIGEGDAQLRWTTSDDFLRWLGSDADLRWEAVMRLGTGQC